MTEEWTDKIEKYAKLMRMIHRKANCGDEDEYVSLALRLDSSIYIYSNAIVRECFIFRE